MRTELPYEQPSQLAAQPRLPHTPGDAHTASPGVPAPTCVLLATLPISMSWTGRGKIGTTKNTKMEFDDLSNRAIGCAIEVHRHLGPGRLESAYEPCLAHELSRHKIAFHLQLTQPVRYKDILLDCGYRIDVLVKNQLIFELKSIENAIGHSRGIIAELYEIGDDQDRTADELQRNQAEGRNEAVYALISFVLFVSFVVKQSILHVSFQAVRSSTENVANNRMHQSRRTVCFDNGEITPATC